MQVIRFDNGSSFTHIGPNAANFRGSASDVSWIDEAQEIAVDEGADLLAAIRPLQDTRPGASVILSGTAGEVRAGVLWEYLDRGRRDDASVSIIDFAADPATPWSVVEDQDRALALLADVHPGLGTLTTLDVMRAQWHDLTRPAFAREYLSLWPETFTTRAIPAALWSRALMVERPPIPDKVAFGWAIRPGGSVAAIAAAWRDADGVAYVEVIAHESGTKWLPERAQYLTRRYRGAAVGFDARGEGGATRTEAMRLSPKPRLAEHRWADITAGSIQFLRDLERGTLRHFGQLALDQAVAGASRRDSGDAGAWTWSPMTSDADIVTLDAATRALRQWDNNPAPAGATRVLRPSM
jgi:hypothetical protein